MAQHWLGNYSALNTAAQAHYRVSFSLAVLSSSSFSAPLLTFNLYFTWPTVNFAVDFDARQIFSQVGMFVLLARGRGKVSGEGGRLVSGSST